MERKIKKNADSIAAVPTVNYKSLTVGVLAAGVNVAYKA